MPEPGIFGDRFGTGECRGTRLRMVKRISDSRLSWRHGRPTMIKRPLRLDEECAGGQKPPPEVKKRVYNLVVGLAGQSVLDGSSLQSPKSNRSFGAAALGVYGGIRSHSARPSAAAATPPPLCPAHPSELD